MAGTLTKDQILDGISELSVLELSELLKEFEERFGVTAAAPAAECHQFSPRCFGSRCAVGQTTGRSGEASSLPSNAPTSKPSGCRCSSFASCTSSATLRLLTQFSVCCIDQLNPPSKAASSANAWSATDWRKAS